MISKTIGYNGLLTIFRHTHILAALQAGDGGGLYLQLWKEALDSYQALVFWVLQLFHSEGWVETQHGELYVSFAVGTPRYVTEDSTPIFIHVRCFAVDPCWPPLQHIYIYSQEDFFSGGSFEPAGKHGHDGSDRAHDTLCVTGTTEIWWSRPSEPEFFLDGCECCAKRSPFLNCL